MYLSKNTKQLIIYVKEGKKYSKDEFTTLEDLIKDTSKKNEEEQYSKENPEAMSNDIIDDLIKYNIIKSADNPEDADSKQKKDEAPCYVFNFVGIVIIRGCIFICLPKYILAKKQGGIIDKEYINNINEKIKLIYKVIEKYNKARKRNISVYDIDGFDSINLLDVQLFLLQDYNEYGVYFNRKEILEVNGTGDIFWDKTINNTFALISNNRTYYTELITRKRINDENDYVKRLYCCVLTEISNELSKANLLTIFGFSKLELSDEKREDFGDTEYILYRLEKEMNAQFDTRKQEVLRSLYNYISHGGKSIYDTDVFSMYGTNKFEDVWEEVCRKVLDDKLKLYVRNLEKENLLPVRCINNNKKHKDFDKTLIELIDKPYWSLLKGYVEHTFRPDTITICKKDGETWFCIFDAKYRCPGEIVEDELDFSLDEEVVKDEYLDKIMKFYKGFFKKTGIGIADLTKQYMYRIAYDDFIKKYKIKKENVKNCFLLPIDKADFSNKKKFNAGYVEMEMFSSFGLENIQVRLLQADEMYGLYLSGKKLNIDELDL